MEKKPLLLKKKPLLLKKKPLLLKKKSAAASVPKIVNNTENVDGEICGYRLRLCYLTVHRYLLGMPRMFSVRNSLSL